MILKEHLNLFKAHARRGRKLLTSLQQNCNIKSSSELNLVSDMLQTLTHGYLTSLLQLSFPSVNFQFCLCSTACTIQVNILHLSYLQYIGLAFLAGVNRNRIIIFIENPRKKEDMITTY